MIGAGYTGLSAALHLAELGASVTVLEAVSIGHGGSGRNVGLVNAGLWVKPDEVVQALGELYADRLLSLLGEAPARVFELIRRYDIRCEAQSAGQAYLSLRYPRLLSE